MFRLVVKKIFRSINKTIHFKTDCKVDGFENSLLNDSFIVEDGYNFTLICKTNFVPVGDAIRYCVKGHIYPDFITHPLSCKSKLFIFLKTQS